MGMPIPIIIDSDAESSPQRKRRRGGCPSDSPPGSPHGSAPQSPRLTAPPRRPPPEDDIPGSVGLRRLIAAADRADRDLIRRALRAELQVAEGDDETPEPSEPSDEDSPNEDSSTLSLDSPRPVHVGSPPFRLPVPRYRMLPTFAFSPTDTPTDTARRMQNPRYSARLARSGALRRLPSPTAYSGAVQPNATSPPTGPSRTRRYGVSADRPGPGSSLPRARRRDPFRLTRPPAPYGADMDIGAVLRSRGLRTVAEVRRHDDGPHVRPASNPQIIPQDLPEFRVRALARMSEGIPHDISRRHRSRRTRMTGLNRDAVRCVEEHYRNAGRSGGRPRGRLDLVYTFLRTIDLHSVEMPPISILYVDESGGADVGDWWELGAWRSGTVLTGRDVFQMLMDVLTECTRIARCKISSLLVCDGLEEVEGVQHGIHLLKNLELPPTQRRVGADVQMQEEDDVPAEVMCSGTFVHPMTGDSINIVLE